MAAGQSRHDLKRHPGLSASRGLGGRVAEYERIAAEQANCELTCLGGFDEQLGILQLGLGIRQRRARLDQVTKPLSQPGRRDDQVGAAE